MSSPLPWRLVEVDKWRSQIRDAEDTPVADIDFTQGDETCQNIIVEAVNSHAQQQERIEELENHIRRMVGDFEDLVSNSQGVSGIHLDGNIAWWSEFGQDQPLYAWVKSFKIARAALSKGASND